MNNRYSRWLLLVSAGGILLVIGYLAGRNANHKASAQRVDSATRCRSDDDCGPEESLCDQAAGRCVECLTDEQCDGANTCRKGRCGESRGDEAVASGQPAARQDLPANGTDGNCAPGNIDTMEAALEGRLPSCEDRVGAWYTFNDQASGTVQSPRPGGIGRPYATPGANGTGHAIRTFGTCAPGIASPTLWGAGIGFDLNNPDGSAEHKRPYAALARGYRGIRFAAKVGKTGNTMQVAVRFPDVNTDPAAGRCSTCYDDYGAVVHLTNNWNCYTILWAQVTRAGHGVPNVAFDPDGLIAVQWRFEPGQVFDLYLDDVAFAR
jgi:hypothetical protein